LDQVQQEQGSGAIGLVQEKWVDVEKEDETKEKID
jgi:hypothetical protein